ncbi:MAG TPA: LytR C-terminal domain-containing protein, partial [Longimicrobiaceae bacterium]|nr:LytR C-terminal domain-containing protein [Longimicrobiaceae bacterium]
GFDAVEMGNATRGTPPRSAVYDRVGNLPAAQQAAAALGISHVEARRDTTLLVDVTVVLGSDWRAPGQQ